MGDGKFKPGADWKGNAAGRPKGVVDKRMRVQQAIRDGLQPVIAKLMEQALEGDTSAAALLLARGIAPLRAESDDRVHFELDTGKPIADQIAQIAQAVASGELTITQGTQFAEILQRIASVRALNQGGDQQEQLIQAMRDMAAGLAASGRA
jgi:hypothetical protein